MYTVFGKPERVTVVWTMLVRLTPKSTRFGDDFSGTLAHWMLARPSADQPVAPADGFKVSSASRIVRKETLELGQ